MLLAHTIVISYICINMIQRIQGTNTKQLSEFSSETSELNDLVCSGSDVIDTKAVLSDLYCAHMCARDLLCHGFFYHPGDGVCVKTNTYFLETDAMALTSYSGMKYYHRGSLWKDWSGWSDCSATCGTGSATRTRTCHPDSPLPCYGPTGETALCNTYSCFNRAKTCADWASKGLNQSASVQIDPLESGSDVTVNCDFDTEPGKAITVMHHNRGYRKLVEGYEESGSYSVNLTYSIGNAEATAIADHSSQCTQYLKYECYNAAISHYVYWRTRNGSQATYFNGSPPPGKRCACGDSGTCSSSTDQCNCDKNDLTLRFDEGFITDKSQLPVLGFDAGDTGDLFEYGYHTIGPLLCS